jgi:translation initiation factor IF-2
MSDDNKPKLGARPPLGIKRTVETGKVKQSFSHGRSKSVVVEVKRRRVAKPGETAPVEAEVAPVLETVVEAPVAVPVAPPPPPPPPPQRAPSARPAAEAAGDSTLTRQELQAKLLREAEEARLNVAEEARRREEDARAAAQLEERRRAEENRRAEEDARRAEEEERARAAAAPQDTGTTPAAPAAAAAPAADDEDGPRGRRPAGAVPGARKVEAPKTPRRGDDNRRQSGKLTVHRALEDEDGVRARSLAALRRAREKDKRSHQSGGSQSRQVREIVLPEVITVQELANRMAERAVDLIKALFKMGVAATPSQALDQDTAELLVTEFGHNFRRVSDADVEIGMIGDADTDEDLQQRPPVVTIMGHVDHGKTSLLDALRGTDVASGEAGGITQHIGAYQVTLKSGEKITFLDTPGHEAFTAMRARGANITDIVVLVVAADDGLMPQTIEAINHTKAAGVPMIVAINKVDKPEANPKRIREALLQYDVQVEEMGGDTQDVEVSAIKRTGLEQLTEKILLQAELLELKANPNRSAEGTVIEAKLDKGRGPVVSVLINRGTLRVGDIFVVGAEAGKVRALIDDRGRQVKEAGPTVPVEILGSAGVPGAGEPLSVVESEARAREVAAYRQSLITQKRTAVTPTSLETMFSNLKENQAQTFPVVIKGDVQGSVEAIIGALAKISTDEIKARVLHSGVGGITESDVTLAKASNAPIIGFGVRANAKAREIATRDGVTFKFYDIIYDLIEDIRNAMAGQLGPEYLEHVVGRAEVRDVFQAGKHGKAAGVLVVEGAIRKNLRARVMRDDVIIYNGSIASLRRFKDDVAEVRSGLECGITLEGSSDVKAGDTIETFEVEERARTL